MRAAQRLWRTGDGLRLVCDGDPDAAILAYATGDDITAADEALLPGDDPTPDPEPEGKQEGKREDKARTPVANKGRGGARRGT